MSTSGSAGTGGGGGAATRPGGGGTFRALPEVAEAGVGFGAGTDLDATIVNSDFPGRG